MDTALGLVFVNISGDAPPLREWLGDILTTVEEYIPTLNSGLVATHRHTYEAACNWKVLIENYLEYCTLQPVDNLCS